LPPLRSLPCPDAHPVESNRLYWREVLKRIVATVKLISSLRLAFRVHDESVNSERKGNFLSCIDYLSEFDPFLKRHQEMYNNCGQGKTNYLPHHICDEFVNLIEDKVKNRIIEEIKEATYYWIIVDSTPDISHNDQRSLIIRYVSNNGSIYERFLGFLPIEHHDAEYLENAILKTLSMLSIDISKYRGQTCDNAANMAGQYSALQARIKKHSATAFYLPCASHSLNLVGNRAAESCLAALTLSLALSS
jgi:hypothetical protein